MNKGDFTVTLLGTGSPVITNERFSSSTPVEVNGQRLLFDAGRGAALRLHQLDISTGMIDKLFVTHLHHDHIMGFDDVFITAAVPDPRGGRENNFRVWGPTGTKHWVEHTVEAYQVDINIRKQVEGASGLDVDVTEFKEDGVVYAHDGVEVIAFEVDHGPMKPAYGYRINYDGRSVVISGDTTYCENLVKHAEGADLIVQEVIAIRAVGEEFASQAKRNIEAYHTTPEQAAHMFQQINPRLVVYTHIAVFDKEAEKTIVPRTKMHYDGEVILGEDLMAIDVGQDEMKVSEIKKASILSV